MEIKYFKKTCENNVEVDGILFQDIKHDADLFFFFYQIDTESTQVLTQLHLQLEKSPTHLKVYVDAQSRSKKVTCYAMVRVIPGK